MPEFNWTGPLRPDKISPKREVSRLSFVPHTFVSLFQWGVAPHGLCSGASSTCNALHALYPDFCAVSVRTWWQIPAHIPKPDYFRDGIPRKEIESKQQNIGG